MHNTAKKIDGSVYFTDTTNVSRIFSSEITYNKGGSAVRVLHYLLGDSLFFRVCKTYQVQFANGNATTNDLRLLVNSLSGKNYDYFFNQWIYGLGYPNYALKWNQIGNQLFINIDQSNLKSANNLFQLSLPIVVKTANSDTTIYVLQGDAKNSYQFSLATPIISVVLDPENWILQRKVNYADVIVTPDEPAKLEVRLFYFKKKGWSRPKAVHNLARLSKGKMIGTRYNEGKNWVGGTIAYFETPPQSPQRGK